MFVEVASSAAMGSFLLYLKFKHENASNDAEKIQRIAANSGLKVKDGNQTKTIQLLRRSPINQGKVQIGMEYAYRIPFGLEVKDFQDKIGKFQDGLNSKQREFELNWTDLKELKLNKDFIKQIKSLINKKSNTKKEIEFSFDGLLKVRIYYDSLTGDFNFEKTLSKNYKGWEVPIGEGRTAFIKHDFESIPNMIVAGPPGFGKSNWLKCLITFLINKKDKDVIFTLIDLKNGLTFSRYKDVKQVKTVAKDNDSALEALKNVEQYMNETNERLFVKGLEDVKEEGNKQRHFIIIDEAADVADDDEFKSLIKNIARKGRSAGLRLIYATQYPTTETVPSQVKRNCIARLCFPVDSLAASTVVIDQSGAEKLPMVIGRAIYKTIKCQEVQTPRIENSFIKQTIQPHINIRPRKEDLHEKDGGKGKEANKHTLIIEQA